MNQPNRSVRTFIILIAALMCSIAVMFAKTAAAETSGAAFLRIDPSPRTYALGGASSVMAFGAQSLNSNPANLGAAKYKYEAFTSFSNPAGNSRYAHASFAVNRSLHRKNRLEGLGVSLTQLSVGNAEGRDRSGAKTSSFASMDRALSVSASSLISDRLRAGATGKLIQSELAGYRAATTFAGDFGISYDLSRDKTPISFGFAMRNAGPGLSYINQTDPLPTSLNAGVGIGLGRATFLAEAVRTLAERQTDFNTGMEFGFGPLALRAGLSSQAGQFGRSATESSIVRNFSYGIGLKLRSVKFDYALSSQPGGLSATHRAALTLTWGAPLDRPRPKIYELSRAQ